MSGEKSEEYYRNPRHYCGDDDELDLNGLSLSSHSGELDVCSVEQKFMGTMIKIRVYFQ